MNKLFELVKERPSPSLTRDETICPFCNSHNVKINEHWETLVGGDPDPNHHWKSSTCNDCKEDFTHEYKYNNVWYTKKGKILKGIPSCFENYIYTCNKCDGDVIRKYTKLDGSDLQGADGIVLTITTTMDGKWIKQFRIFYVCQKCNSSIEVPDEYYNEG